MTPTPRFLEHASGSAGIFGGNPHGSLWFCGIEFGTAAEAEAEAEAEVEAQLDDVEWRPVEAHGLPCWTDAYHLEMSRLRGGRNTPDTWGFIQKMARIALGFDGRSDAPAWEVKEYIRTRILRPNGDTFHVNLYPVPFHVASDSGFKLKHMRLTGFPNKTTYRAWCMENRFPRLKAMLEYFRPPVIVCVGSQFARDFRLAFLGADRVFEEGGSRIMLESAAAKAGEIASSPKQIDLHWANDGTSLVAIAPFLGAGGLMSSTHLHRLGRELRSRVRLDSRRMCSGGGCFR